MFGYPRIIYFCYLTITIIVGGVLAYWAPYWLILWLLPAAFAAVGVCDLNSSRNVLRNYPMLGRLRYLMEFIRPELRQYFFESQLSGRPINREQRMLVHARADGKGDTSPLGTKRDIEDAGSDFVEHSMAPRTVDKKYARIMIGGTQCSHPYNSSRLNISAMSFGALSGAAVEAMNKGAKLG